MTKVILIIYIFLFNLVSYSNGNQETIIHNQDTSSFIQNKIKELLIEKNSFIYSPIEDDIEIYIDNKSKQKILFNKDDIEDIQTTNINKLSKSFKIKIMLNGNQDIDIHGKYVEFVEIPTFKKSMKNGYIISEDEISSTRTDASRISYEIITNSKDIIGKTPKYTIASNVPIRRDMISSLNLINKRDSVTVLYKKDNLELKMIGTALDSGAIGDTIRVQNTRSDQILSGTIQENKQVVIN